MEESRTDAYFDSAKGAIQLWIAHMCSNRVLTLAATEARLLGTQLRSQAVNEDDSLE